MSNSKQILIKDNNESLSKYNNIEHKRYKTKTTNKICVRNALTGASNVSKDSTKTRASALLLLFALFIVYAYLLFFPI